MSGYIFTYGGIFQEHKWIIFQYEIKNFYEWYSRARCGMEWNWSIDSQKNYKERDYLLYQRR